MLAVLSPAKTLDMSPLELKLASTEPTCMKEAEELLKEMQKLTKAELKKLMGVSDQIAQLNFERFCNFKDQPAKQAVMAFDGPAFRGLDFGSLSEAQQGFAQDHIRILCGLYGVVRPLDLIHPYRLEMGASLPNSRGKNLYHFWGDIITSLLLEDIMRLPPPSSSAAADSPAQRLLVNCASQEYFKAIRPAILADAGVRVITCEFPGPTVFAKRARGLMVRHIAAAGKDSAVDYLRAFAGGESDPYEFSPDRSGPDTLVFLRRLPPSIPRPPAASSTAPAARSKAAAASQRGRQAGGGGDEIGHIVPCGDDSAAQRAPARPKKRGTAAPDDDHNKVSKGKSEACSSSGGVSGDGGGVAGIGEGGGGGEGRDAAGALEGAVQRVTRSRRRR